VAAYWLWLLPDAAVSEQVRPLDLAAGGWRLAGEARVDTVEGEPVVYLRSGRALRTDVRFTDGTLEFEMRPTDRRAFLGVVFRAASGDKTEDIYFRLHKSQLPDAIQYSPDYGGRGQWQLYHGPGDTAAARYVPGAWQPVRIEVKGGQAAVFVGAEAQVPQLVVDRLRSGATIGGIGFWGNQPGATGDDPPSALLRRMTLRHGETSYPFREPEPEPWAPNVVRRWGVSVEPAGMTSTRFDDALAIIPRRAARYSFYHPWTYKESSELYRVPTWDYSFNLGGGGLLSTAGDLARFGDRMTGPGLLSEEARDLFFSDAWFGRTRADGERWAPVTGSNPGVQAGLAIFPQRRAAAAVLANAWGLGSRSAEMVGIPAALADACIPVKEAKQ
jgi:hypothetical protein